MVTSYRPRRVPGVRANVSRDYTSERGRGKPLRTNRQTLADYAGPIADIVRVVDLGAPERVIIGAILRFSTKSHTTLTKR